jgi:ABC-type multidrug transport system fused ATPase/permease subunit
MSRKNLFTIIVVTGIVLFIPFIAMLFKDQVRWSTFDFVLMDLMIFSSVLLGVTFQKKIKIPKKEYW